MAGLVLRGLRKRFGDTVALDGVDLAVEPGRLLGLLGPNGAGKTTTMRAVLRLVDLDAGDVTWDGAPLDEAARRSIGYLPQERGLYVRMSVHEQVAWFGRLAGMSRADAATQADRWIERVGLADRREDLVQALSVGNQQRVQLAVAMVHRPRLLVFDEPFAGLDRWSPPSRWLPSRSPRVSCSMRCSSPSPARWCRDRRTLSRSCFR